MGLIMHDGVPYSGGDGTQAVELTTAQYNALSSAEKHDTSKVYYLTDGQGGGGSSSNLELIETFTHAYQTSGTYSYYDNLTKSFSDIKEDYKYLYCTFGNDGTSADFPSQFSLSGFVILDDLITTTTYPNHILKVSMPYCDSSVTSGSYGNLIPNRSLDIMLFCPNNTDTLRVYTSAVSFTLSVNHGNEGTVSDVRWAARTNSEQFIFRLYGVRR